LGKKEMLTMFVITYGVAGGLQVAPNSITSSCPIYLFGSGK
jgi:hypothetical protein